MCWNATRPPSADNAGASIGSGVRIAGTWTPVVGPGLKRGARPSLVISRVSNHSPVVSAIGSSHSPPPGDDRT